VRAGDVVARLAGDEFAILCEGLDAPALDALAARVRTALGAPLVLGGTELHPSAVIGITAGSGPRRDPEGLLREATAAMHGAKLTGRAVAHHQPGTRDGAERALRTEAELHHALDRGELVLHYQPQLDLAAAARCGASRRSCAGSTPSGA
jgi:predicted signal transduction protein with EAL and GGDEF domain